jgi:hypothetical protein
MTELNNNDYKQILEYYNKEIPKSKRLLKQSAENILANKLCRCIKKVDKKNEGRAIGICTKTILNRRGYTRGKFKCKGKATIKLIKSKKNITKRHK